MNIYCFSTLSFAKLQFKSVINKVFHKHGVASFTDAWIETPLDNISATDMLVASFTDAWIETYKEIIEGRFDVSHLLQMRGLKHIGVHCTRCAGVASFTDAWIETLYRSFCYRENAVASFTDAWIETNP